MVLSGSKRQGGRQILEADEFKEWMEAEVRRMLAIAPLRAPAGALAASVSVHLWALEGMDGINLYFHAGLRFALLADDMRDVK